MNIDEFKKLIRFRNTSPGWSNNATKTTIQAEIRLSCSMVISELVDPNKVRADVEEQLTYMLAEKLFVKHRKEVADAVMELLYAIPLYNGNAMKLAERVVQAATRQPDITIEQFMDKCGRERAERAV